jgi:hypothetical protein
VSGDDPVNDVRPAASCPAAVYSCPAGRFARLATSFPRQDQRRTSWPSRRYWAASFAASVAASAVVTIGSSWASGAASGHATDHEGPPVHHSIT